MPIYLQLLETQEEKDKFTRIYTEYRGLMMYIARRFFQGQADCEIAVDKAFFSIVKILDSIEETDSARVRNLVVLITRNKCIDMLRTRHGYTDADFETVECQAGMSGSEGVLDHAIASMSPAGRDLIYLRYLHGYRTGEIAKIYDISREAAKKRIQRAVAELKKILEEDR